MYFEGSEKKLEISLKNGSKLSEEIGSLPHGIIDKRETGIGATFMIPISGITSLNKKKSPNLQRFRVQGGRLNSTFKTS